VICDCCATSAATAQFFDEARARRELAGYHRRGPGPTTRRLLAGLRADAAAGTLIDVGTGSGVIVFELLKSGITSAVGVDLSPGSLGVARQETVRQGVSDRITWLEGDLTRLAASLPPADVVTLDRVVCCYPAYRSLLEEAASRSRRWLAFSYPHDRWYVRAMVWIGNVWLRLRRSVFRAYVHSVPAMDSVLREAGFVPVYQAGTVVWQTSVYRRERP
jgi:magnesium-protoporphyrin O-methyltransferase